MAKRGRSEGDKAADALSELLMNAPVWLGPVLAVVGFLGLRYLVPAVLLTGNDLFYQMAGGISRLVAPFAALFVVLIWIGTEFKKTQRRKLLDRQGGVDSLRGLTWREFEQLVGEAYRRQGYYIEETGGGGADGGVDLVLIRGREKVLIQCKRWKVSKVGVEIIRELFGVMTAEKASRGVVVTCGRFTGEAERFAEGKPLELLDGPALWRLVQDVKSGTPASQPQSSPPAATLPEQKPAQTVAPAVTATTPSCPRCGSQMTLRTAHRGPNAGSQFYGCPRYPECRGTRDLRSANEPG